MVQPQKFPTRTLYLEVNRADPQVGDLIVLWQKLQQFSWNLMICHCLYKTHGLRYCVNSGVFYKEYKQQERISERIIYCSYLYLLSFSLVVKNNLLFSSFFKFWSVCFVHSVVHFWRTFIYSVDRFVEFSSLSLDTDVLGT